MAVSARYVFGEAWSIARSGSRQTTMAVALIALGLFVPGLLVLLSRNLGRLATAGGDAPAAVVTLEPAADGGPVTPRIAADPRVARVRLLSRPQAPHPFPRPQPDLRTPPAHLEA